MTQEELLRKLEELAKRWRDDEEFHLRHLSISKTDVGRAVFRSCATIRGAAANDLEKLIGEYGSPISEAKADDG